MRRFFTFSALLCATLFLFSCNDNDDWTPRQQISRVANLIDRYPATPDNMQQFIDDILQGVWDIDDWITYLNGTVWGTSYGGFDYVGFGKDSQFLDLVFYPNGTCRQCYLYAPAPYNNIPYPFLYTTLNWSYDIDEMTITLTNNDYLLAGSNFATTQLTLRYYRYGEFIMDGLQPSSAPLTGYTIRYIGEVDGSGTRAEFEDRFKDETVFGSLNGETFR